MFLVVFVNTPWSGPSAHELTVLALLGHSSHHEVIPSREMLQHLSATAARSVGATIDVDALQHHHYQGLILR